VCCVCYVSEEHTASFFRVTERVQLGAEIMGVEKYVSHKLSGFSTITSAST
jgi:hypothetical protein